MLVVIAIEQCKHKQAREPYAWARLNCAYFRVLLALACLINFFLVISCLALDKNIESLLVCLLEMLQIEIGLLACKLACFSAFKSSKQACNTGQIYSIYVILALKMSKCITFWTNIRLKIHSIMLALALEFARLLTC